MQLNDYQRHAFATNEQRHLSVHVWGLVGEVGSIVALYRKRFENGGRYPGFNTELAEELGDAFWYLSNIAKLENISLEKIGQKNIEKAKRRFSKGKKTSFDKTYAEDERLPRQFDVEFSEKKVGQSVQVKLMTNGVIIGDALTDNAYDKDGYRFHDAFHLSFAAILGWSPVIRGVLKRKRKSNRRIDEIEDGARAAIIEEAISIYVFNHAKAHGLYEGVKVVEFRIIRAVQDMVQGLEVKECTAKQWQHAILEGYRIFRELRKSKGGTVHVDLDRQEISFRHP